MSPVFVEYLFIYKGMDFNSIPQGFDVMQALGGQI